MLLLLAKAKQSKATTQRLAPAFLLTECGWATTRVHNTHNTCARDAKSKSSLTMAIKKKKGAH